MGEWYTKEKEGIIWGMILFLWMGFALSRSPQKNPCSAMWVSRLKKGIFMESSARTVRGKLPF